MIWMLWTSDDVADMISVKLSFVGLSFPVEDVLELINLTHLSNDATEDSIWFAIEDAINLLAYRRLGHV